MSILNKTYDAWWTTPRAGVGAGISNSNNDVAPATISYSRFTSPLWSSSNSTFSTKSFESKTSVGDYDMSTSTRALQLRYNELSTQLQQCHEWETQLQGEQQRIVSMLFINNKNYGAVAKPISPPLLGEVAGEATIPPTREALLSRLIDGKREDYRRIFVPGRGWVSKSKLQSELQVTEDELERLARK